MLGSDVGKAFNVNVIWSSEMENAVKKWDNISTGKPPWLKPDDDIETVNFAKLISDTRAKLTTLDIGIACSGSERADFLQSICDELLKYLPDKVAEADRLGGMIIKWNGICWDFVMPGQFGITSKSENDEITGAIFAEHTVEKGKYYTRLEYHRFESMDEHGPVYVITNKAFLNQQASNNTSILGREVKLSSIEKWKNYQETTAISKLKKPLYGFFRLPGANTIDADSPLGLSVFANAITELKAIDIAISRKNTEIEDSKHVTFVGQQIIQNAMNKGIQLPRFVKGLGMGISDGEISAIHEHVPTLLTEQRIKDINFNLSMAGVKCGFSEGVFVMDGQTGMITATQVEADDRDTIQTVKNDRDALKSALQQALYGADAIATLKGLAPLGEYQIDFNFGDITYSYEEDKANWKSYVQQGWVPKWLYFVKFEGMSETEAKAFVQEAEASNKKENGLFDME